MNIQHNIKHNIQLKPYNSLRTQALAKLFCEPQSIDELSEIIKKYPDEKKLVLGGGFNLFFTKDFDGLIVHQNMKGINIWYEDANFIEIEVNAAESWDDF